MLATEYREFLQTKIKTQSNFEANLEVLISKANVRIKKIFFSSNEKFCVLITNDKAFVVRIEEQKFSFVAQIKLPGLEEHEENEATYKSGRNARSVLIENLSDLDFGSEADGVKLRATENDDLVLLQVPIEENAKPKLNINPVTEKARKQNNSKCNGFFNSPWTAAVDNEGKYLVLHTSESFKIVDRTYEDD
jgi:hypothetical protein